MHADEVAIDADLVRRLIAAQFPEWAGLPIERYASGGTCNAIYRLGADKYVRLPLIEAFVHALDWEAKWLPRLAPRLPLAIPEVLGRGTPGEGYPFEWSVYRWIEGETWRLDHVDDSINAALKLAAFIAALREIDGADAAKPPALWAASLPTRDAWVRATIDASRDMIDADALTAAWDAAVTLPVYDGPPIWVHSDMLRGNVLVKHGQLEAIVDFGCVHGGDPARDLVAGWTLLTREARNVFRDALSVDDVTWARARAWAIPHVGAIPYYRETNRNMVEGALQTIGEILADLESGA